MSLALLALQPTHVMATLLASNQNVYSLTTASTASASRTGAGERLEHTGRRERRGRQQTAEDPRWTKADVLRYPSFRNGVGPWIMAGAPYVPHGPIREKRNEGRRRHNAINRSNLDQ
jgi:hypothetical protein